MSNSKPNVVFVFGDQWRAQATGYAGDPNVKTPHLDRLKAQSVDFTHAIAGCPVCSPYRASLLTGQYPDRHGIFLNDVCLQPEGATLGECFRDAGYRTAYIGKWHLDGHGRRRFIPRERRLGFEHWLVCECTHDYNNSVYYADTDEALKWEGYDAAMQTRAAEAYIRETAPGPDPFFLVLSWGPPHNPYETAPEQFRAMYQPENIELHPNVPPEAADQARQDLAGYYAHISALDAQIGSLLETLDVAGVADDTLFVFTSDHGDMIGCQGLQRKQHAYDESIRVPFLMRWPSGLGNEGREVDAPINAPDLMPTLLGLCGIASPETVQGDDFSPCIRGEAPAPADAALLACYVPFGEYPRQKGGAEYRGLRTRRHTYVRTLAGPMLLFDNDIDPHQQNNLCDTPDCADLQRDLDAQLDAKLAGAGDEFLQSEDYIERWGYEVDDKLTVPYHSKM